MFNILFKMEKVLLFVRLSSYIIKNCFFFIISVCFVLTLSHFLKPGLAVPCLLWLDITPNRFKGCFSKCDTLLVVVPKIANFVINYNKFVLNSFVGTRSAPPLDVYYRPSILTKANQPDTSINLIPMNVRFRFEIKKDIKSLSFSFVVFLLFIVLLKLI